MPVSLPDQKKASVVTSGEIVAGVAWLAAYGLIMLVSLSQHSGQLVAAINLSGLY
jgi:hypothetical protein